MSDLIPLARAHCLPRRGSEHRLADARVRELLPEVADWTLAEEGKVPVAKVAEAIQKYGINTEKVNPLYA